MNTHLLPDPIKSPLLVEAQDSGIIHGFFTRTGGVSTGIYAGLNVGLGSEDDRDHVLENRRRVAAWFGRDLDQLATTHQVHSPDVVVIDEHYSGIRSKADALVTATPGKILGVLAADCGPILFADGKNRVVGAAHAGWKGAFTGVAEATIEAMLDLGAERAEISACLGPSISKRNYEVGPEFVARFTDEDPGFAIYFTPSAKPGHHMFDLPSFTLSRLLRAGIRAENLDICTYPDEDRFFSYRRTTHRQEPDYGRQISAIMIGS